MPCGYHINADAGLVTITGTDETTAAQFVELGERLLADANFDSKLAQLMDLRGLNMAFQKDDSERVLDFSINTYSPQIEANIAIIVDGDQDSKSIASMFRLTCAMHKTELFDNYDQALRWLMRREFA
jgi:hypothetical protein